MYNFNNYIKNKNNILESITVLPKLRKTQVLAFITSQKEDTIRIDGYVTKKGKLYKFIKKILLSDLLKTKRQNNQDHLKYIPVIDVLYSIDILKLLDKSEIVDIDQQKLIEKRLKKLISRKQKIKYSIYYDLYYSKIFVISKKNQEKFNNLLSDFENIKNSQSKIRSTILHNRHNILANIQKHRETFKKFLLTQTQDMSSIIKHKKLFDKEKGLIETYLNNIIKKTVEQKKEVEKTNYFPHKEEYISQKEKQINQLTDLINKFKEEMSISVDYFKNAEEERKDLLKNVKSKDKILDEFIIIKLNIIDYYNKWLEWFNNEKADSEIDNEFLVKNKKLLIQEFNLIKQKFLELSDLINEGEYITIDEIEKRKLQQNITDIELIMQKFLSEQFTEISKEQSKKIEKKQQLLLNLQHEIEKYSNSIKNDIVEIENILESSNQKLLNIDENNLYNYQNCLENFKQFISVNNTFVRLKKMISKIDKINNIMNITTLNYEDIELEMINPDDKKRYIKHSEDIKDMLNKLLEKINLVEIHDNDKYKEIITYPHKAKDITIGLCTQISKKIVVYINFFNEIEYILTKIKDFIEMLKKQPLNSTIVEKYTKVPNITIKNNLI